MSRKILLDAAILYGCLGYLLPTTTASGIEAACNCTAPGEAKYSFVFHALWLDPKPPVQSAACGAPRYSQTYVTSHSPCFHLWEVGAKATSSFAQFSLTGATPDDSDDFQVWKSFKTSQINSLNASSSVYGSLRVTRDFPLVSAATKILPSPDWFVGVDSISSLCTGDHWISSLSVPVYPHDAGTASGLFFNSSCSQPASRTDLPISLLTPNSTRSQSFQKPCGITSSLGVYEFTRQNIVNTVLPFPTCRICSTLTTSSPQVTSSTSITDDESSGITDATPTQPSETSHVGGRCPAFSSSEATSNHFQSCGDTSSSCASNLLCCSSSDGDSTLHHFCVPQCPALVCQDPCPGRYARNVQGCPVCVCNPAVPCSSHSTTPTANPTPASTSSTPIPASSSLPTTPASGPTSAISPSPVTSQTPTPNPNGPLTTFFTLSPDEGNATTIVGNVSVATQSTQPTSSSVSSVTSNLPVTSATSTNSTPSSQSVSSIPVTNHTSVQPTSTHGLPVTFSSTPSAQTTTTRGIPSTSSTITSSSQTTSTSQEPTSVLSSSPVPTTTSEHTTHPQGTSSHTHPTTITSTASPLMTSSLPMTTKPMTSSPVPATFTAQTSPRTPSSSTSGSEIPISSVTKPAAESTSVLVTSSSLLTTGTSRTSIVASPSSSPRSQPMPTGQPSPLLSGSQVAAIVVPTLLLVAAIVIAVFLIHRKSSRFRILLSQLGSVRTERAISLETLVNYNDDIDDNEVEIIDMEEEV